MSILTRSATLPYATADRAVLMAAASRLLLDPVEIGPIRLVGVGFSGFSDVQQTSLFPDLDLPDQDAATESADPVATDADDEKTGWRLGDDVRHPELGHGWIQGVGHGVMTIRFETRSTGPGLARTFQVDDVAIERSDPLECLQWPGLAEPTSTGDG